MSDSERAAELRRKLGELGARRGLSPAALFRTYDGDGDGALVPDELEALLRDADVGGAFTRRAWVNGVLERLDRDQGGALTWPEVQAVLSEVPPPTPEPPKPPPVVPVPTPKPAPAPRPTPARAPVNVVSVALFVLAVLVARRLS